MASWGSVTKGGLGSGHSEKKNKVMLLIGESGAGKSSFLDLIKNYENQRDKTFEVSEIRRFTPPPKSGLSMKSLTRNSKSYKVDVGEFIIDIIDTPGLADTSGAEQNQKNIDNIIAALKKAKNIHCICLVINGTHSRMNSLMKNVFTEVKRALSPEVLDNFIIVLTKVHDVYNTCFEISSLKDFDISTNFEYTFCFENPYARWCKAKEMKSLRDSEEVKREFLAAFKTLKKMFITIKFFPPIKTDEFGKFNEVINDMNKYLISMRLNLENDMTLKEVMMGVKVEMEHQIDVLRMGLSLPPRKIHNELTAFLDTPGIRNIVCMATKCNHNCHENCTCWFTGTNWLVGFFFRYTKMCRCFKNGTCQECGHNYKVHCKQEKRYEKVVDDFEFSSVNKNNFEEQKKRCEHYIKKQEDEMAKIEKKNNKEIETFFVKLEIFKEMGSHPYYFKDASEVTEIWKEEVCKFPEFIRKQEVLERILITEQED